ncbi:MAG: VanW family protein [Chloroflexota bacterium]|nr:VanW family protein [Chloroflexota bacterium]
MGQQQRVSRQSSATTAQFAIPACLDDAYPAPQYADEYDHREDFGSAPPVFASAGGPRHRMPARAFAIGGIVIIVALFVGLVGCLAVSASLNGKLYDNVYVNNQNIGGLTPDAARAALNARLIPALNSPITLTNNGTQWTPKPAELGMRVAVDRTVDEAYRAGRSGGPLGRLWRAVEMQQGAKQYIPLYLQVDDQTLTAYLDGVQAQLGTPQRDASVAVQGNQIVVTPGTDGTKLDRDALKQQLLASMAHLTPASIALPVTFAKPTITTDAAEQAKARAEALVGSPLVLTFNDKHWDLSPDELVGALRFNANLDVRIDAAALMPRINAIADAVKQDPQNAVIGWDTHLIVSQSAKNGQQLNVAETVSRINAWNGDVRTLALPVEIARPRITDDVGALGITTRLGVGVSNFSGSDAARVTNIKVSAGYLDDTVVAPGEVFSFLDSIGEISAARGYKDGYVILAEQTVPGIGGGICQVATTMFRAAMYSGLPIEERNPHAYIVGYYQQGGYPIGLDAAVFSPGVDFKFRNETDKYMLIKTAIDSGNLYISIYGSDLGYKVNISDPIITNKTKPPDDEYQVDPTLPSGAKKQVEFAKSGEDVALTRTVLSSDGKVVRQATFNTHYQAWPNKFLVNKETALAKTVKATTAPNTPAPKTKVPDQPTKTVLPAASQAALPTKPPATPVQTKKP